MKLYFTRHGKTEWNQELRFQGMTGDSSLLPSSYEEIRQLGQALKNVPLKKIFSSSSTRAKLTAQGINNELKQPVEIIYTDKLKELGLGKLEGQLIEEMREEHAQELDHMRFRLDKYNPKKFDGEPIMDAVERISSFVKSATEETDGPILFVGHGASLTAGIQYLSGKPLSKLRDMGGLKNNSLSILELNSDKDINNFKLKLWNDDSFLEKK